MRAWLDCFNGLRRTGLACAALVMIAFAGSATPVAAQSIDVSWDANTESNLAGYRVFVGTAPGSYSQSFDVPATSTTFSFVNPAPLTRYYFVVAAFDTNGDQSAYSNEVSAVLGGDTIAPSLAITSPLGSVTVTTGTLALAGTASDNVGISHVTWWSDRGGSGTALGTTAWSASVTLQPGANVITVTASDGENTRTATVTVTYNPPDTTLPNLSITSPSGSVTVTTSSIAMSGTASDNIGVTQVSWSSSRGGSGTATGTTSWSATVPLVAGSNVITVTARDAANNTRTAQRTITYNVPDTTAPTVTVGAPTGSPTVALTSLAVSGTASDNVGVTQVTWANSRGGSGTATGTTVWSASMPLQSGTNVITMTARDAANNTSQASVTVSNVSVPNPAMPYPVSPSGTLANTAPSFTWTRVSGAASYQLWVNDASGNGRIQSTHSAQGACSTAIGLCTVSPGVTLTGAGQWWVRNASGGDWSPGLTFVAPAGPDTTLPALAISSPANASTVGTSTIALSGTASDNVGVTQVTWSSDRGGSGTASGTTSWSVSGVALLSGANVLTVTARDAANNTRTAAVTVTYNPPDTTLPSVAITSPAGAVTVTTPSIALSGTASDNVGVTQVTWINNRGGSGTASGTTSWSVAGVSLQAGSNVITVTARDAASNLRQTAVTVTYEAPVDTTLPSLAITTPGSAVSVSSGSIVVSGTAGDNVGVTQVTWSNNRGGSGTATGTTIWSAYVALQSGDNVITVRARDAANNTRQASVTVTYLAPPTSLLPMPVSPSGTSSSSTPSFTWTPAANAPTYQLWVNDSSGSGRIQGFYTAAQAGCTVGTVNCTVSPGVALTGTVQWWVRNASVNGDWGASLMFTVPAGADNTQPSLAIASPAGPVTVTSATIAVSGTASDNVAVTQVSWSNDRGGSGTATGTAAWTVPGLALVSGANVITITARDAANNTRSAAVTVTYNPPDTAPPTISISSPAGAVAVTTGSIALSGNASDNVGVTQVTWSNNRGGSGTAAGTTSWSVGAVALQSGTNVITVTSRDASNNTAQDSVTVTYNVIDTTAPALSITSPSNNATFTAPMVSVSGAASDSVGVTQVTWASSRGGSGTASGTTLWSASVPLQSGSNVITVTARDASNNARQAAVTVTYDASTVSVIPVPLSPSGSSSTAAPSFTWAAGRGVLTYQLWVNDGAGNGRIQTIYTAAQAGCATGNTCTVSPGVTLTGLARWWIRNANGGDWGTSLAFTVPSGGDVTPPTVAIASPASGTTVTGAAVALAGTAGDNVGVTQIAWVTDRGASGTASGTTSWSVSSVPLQVGSNLITVTGRDAAGNTRQASITVTYVPPSGPTVPVPVSPSGAAASRTPAFTWTAVPTASAYQIWANDSAGNGRIQHTYTAGQAGCGSGTGTCSAAPGVTLTGTVQWWVRVTSPSGDWSTPLTFTVP